MDQEGRRIPGADVLVVASGYTRQQAREDPSGAAAAWIDLDHHFRARADLDGEYRVSGIRFAGQATVYGYAEGYVAGVTSYSVTLVPGEHRKNVDIFLSKGMIFRGRVLATSGAPAANSVVQSRFFIPVEEARLYPVADYFAPTNADGRFTLGFPAEGVCSLRAISETHGGCTFSPVPVSDEEVELVMTEPATLAGRITWSDGTPAEGMVVSLQGERSLDYGKVMVGGKSGAADYSGTVDAAGQYRIPGIDSGAVVCQAAITTPDHTPLSEEVELGTLAPGETRVWDCVLREAIVVKGHVYGEQTGRPLRELRVSWQKEGSDTKGREDVSADGSYELRIMSGPGTYLIYPRRFHPDPAAAAELYGKRVELKALQVAELDLTLPDPVTVSVRVVDAKGGPVSGAIMGFGQRFESGNVGLGGIGVTDQSGRFSWSGFEPDADAHLTVDHPEFVSAQSAWYVGAPGQAFPEETIVLYEHAGVAGMAVDQDGNPITNAAVGIRAHYDNGRVAEVRIRTDDTGAFSCAKGIPATEVVLDISVDDGVQERSWTSEPVQCVAGHIMDFSDIVFLTVGEPGGTPGD